MAQWKFARVRLACAVSASVFGFCTYITPAAAQDASPGQTTDQTPVDEATPDRSQEIVVIGFKHEQMSSALKGDVAVRDVPLTIASYSREFINDVEATNVSDLFNYTVGVQRAGPTGYDITIRGFQSGAEDRNSILVDGLPGLTTTRGSPPTINISSMDIVKGPASVLYGQVQPGGFVNIITKKPLITPRYEFRLRSQAYASSDTSFGDTLGLVASADLTGPLSANGNIAYRLVGEYRDQPSFYDGSFSRSKYVAPSVSVAIDPDTDLLLQGEYINSTGNLYDGLVAYNLDYRNIADRTTRYSEPGDPSDEEGYGGTITLDHRFSDAVKWHTAFRAVHHEDDYSGLRNRSFVNPTTLRRQVRTQTNLREYYFVDSNLSVRFDAGPIENKVLVGVNGGRATTDFFRSKLDNGNATTNIDIYDPMYGLWVPRSNNSPNHAYTRQDTVGVYLQDQLKFTEQLKGVAAIRYEKFKTEGIDVLNPGAPHDFARGNQVSPMVGLIFQPDRQWSIYASYATSFNPPVAGGVDASGNPINTPETGKQLEGGVKAILLNGHLSATASVFKIDKSNVTESLGNNVFALIGAERSVGGELELTAELTPNWKLISGYSYIEATVSSDANPLNVGQRLTNVPLNTGSIFTRYDVPSGPLAGFGASVGVSYTGQRFGTLPDGNNPRLELPAYTVVDFGLFYEAKPFSISLLLNNAFDDHYFESASNEFRIQPGAPRSIVLSLKTVF